MRVKPPPVQVEAVVLLVLARWTLQQRHFDFGGRQGCSDSSARERTRKKCYAVRFSILILMAAMAPAAAMPVEASAANGPKPARPALNTTDTGCNGPYVILYEHASYGGNSLLVCYPTAIPELRNVPAPQGCDGGWLIYAEWHDCISSFKVIGATCHYKFKPYQAANYGSLMPSPYTQFGSHNESTLGAYNDTMSSLNWEYRSPCIE